MERLNVLGEEIISQQGSFKRIRQYVEGWHPQEGVLHFGWSGKETIVERDVITPIKVIDVEDYNLPAHLIAPLPKGYE